MMIKSQLLYQLSYAPKSLMPKGDSEGFAPPDSGRNGNGTYIYGKHGVASTSPSLDLTPIGPALPADPADAIYLDESNWPRCLDSGDQALVPQASDRALYILLAIMLVGLTALFGASAYILLG